MKQLTVNELVTVTQVGFKKNLIAYPRRIEFRGTVYEFLDAGLHCTVRRGDQVAHIMTMTDGHQQFRLRCDNKGGVWTLVSIVS